MYPFLTTAAVSIVVICFVLSLIRKSMYASALQDLRKGSFAAYDQKMQTSVYRFFFPRSRLAEMKLNGALLQNSPKKVKEAAEELEALHLKSSSQEAINMKLFNFYLGRMDRKNTRLYLKKVNAGSNEQMKKEAGRAYRIYIEKKGDDLQDLLREMDQLPSEKRGVHEYLISRIYENAGDRKMAKLYAASSKEHLSQLDEQTRARWETENQPANRRLRTAR